MGLKIEDVPGVTVNRYCASGLETIGMATAKSKGMAHCIIAGGAESMSFIPMGGKPTLIIMLLQKQETKITGEWV
jgi:acetyl-CoA acyltransferase